MATILLIDNDDIVRKVIRLLLIKNGFNVIEVTNGNDAFEQILQGGYDVVLTELMMPLANGLEIISKIRSESPCKDAGIIVVSAVRNEESIMEAFGFGAEDYLRKPIMLEELLLRVKKLLKSKTLSE